MQFMLQGLICKTFLNIFKPKYFKTFFQNAFILILWENI